MSDKYSEQYKDQACRLVTHEKYFRKQAAKALGIPVACLRRRRPAILRPIPPALPLL